MPSRRVRLCQTRKHPQLSPCTRQKSIDLNCKNRILISARRKLTLAHIRNCLSSFPFHPLYTASCINTLCAGIICRAATLTVEQASRCKPTSLFVKVHLNTTALIAVNHIDRFLLADAFRIRAFSSFYIASGPTLCRHIHLIKVPK